MRVIVLVKASQESEAGVMPDQKLLADMGKFNEQLVEAGVMQAGEGLHPSPKGVRVRFAGGGKSVIDGPFTETKELVAGFWIWKVASMKEAIEWLKRAPFEETEVEIRPTKGQVDDLMNEMQLLKKLYPLREHEGGILNRERSGLFTLMTETMSALTEQTGTSFLLVHPVDPVRPESILLEEQYRDFAKLKKRIATQLEN